VSASAKLAAALRILEDPKMPWWAKKIAQRWLEVHLVAVG
jgi:hypothetical protein